MSDQFSAQPLKTTTDDNWEHRSKKMKCSTCMYFVIKQTMKPSVNLNLGRCRRKSPSISGFPAVFESDWCGDHKLDENKI